MGRGAVHVPGSFQHNLAQLQSRHSHQDHLPDHFYADLLFRGRLHERLQYGCRWTRDGLDDLLDQLLLAHNLAPLRHTLHPVPIPRLRAQKLRLRLQRHRPRQKCRAVRRVWCRNTDEDSYDSDLGVSLPDNFDATNLPEPAQK